MTNPGVLNSEELAQNGVRRETGFATSGGARRTVCAWDAASARPGLFLVPPSRQARFEAEAMPQREAVERAARSLVRNAAEGEELAQDVFYHAWRSFDRYEPGTNCRAWLFGILFHRLYHSRRQRARLVYGDWVEEAAAKLRAPEPAPEGIADGRMLAALARLPERLRRVLLLADLEEYSYKEVAATLAIPIGTVMSRLSRARERMRRMMKG